MQMKKLHNPSNVDVTDYSIAEATFDSNGAMILDKQGNPVTTNQTLEWNLKSGETLEFPAYVADYLKKIYDFLEVVSTIVETPKEVIGEVPVATKTEGQVICRGCQKEFKSPTAVAMHMAHHHPELL